MHALFTGALARSANGRHSARPRVLDAGCGTGGLMQAIEKAAGSTKVVGVDVSAVGLGLAKNYGHRQLARASIERMPFRDETFDVVVSADVLCHVTVLDDARAVTEFARVLKPGGFVLLNLPAHSWMHGAHDVITHTVRRFTRDDVRRMAKAAGLVVEQSTWWNCALFPVAMAWRPFSRGKGSQSDLTDLPAPVNGVLGAWTRFEAWWTLRMKLPWGLSLFSVLRKPAA
jgi:ubiquinone/menaquinone biosynthesis C-methylase UbiE